jgi:hypothetical protein
MLSSLATDIVGVSFDLAAFPLWINQMIVRFIHLCK